MTARGVVLEVERWWECPSCGFQHRSTQAGLQSKFHSCPSLGGINGPLVEVTNNHGIKPGTVRHVAVEREDYIGREVGVRHDDQGRAVMAVRTERADGSNDCLVLAPTATADPDQLKELLHDDSDRRRGLPVGGRLRQPRPPLPGGR